MGIFSKKKQTSEIVLDNTALIKDTVVEEKEKNINDLVEEIHETFFTEVDRLFKTANELNSIETNKQDLIDKCNRLQALGFVESKEVKEASGEIKRLDNLKKENEDKKELIEAISYFSFKYPQYKFITESSVKKICRKYGLVYGAVDKYTGEVPDKNLKHIEEFKIDENDEAWIQIVGNLFMGDNITNLIEGKDVPKEQYYQASEGYFTRYSKTPLEIAAPIKDFKMEKSVVKDHKIQNEIPDPVVLKPVIFKKKKYYLIVTAWA